MCTVNPHTVMGVSALAKMVVALVITVMQSRVIAVTTTPLVLVQSI